MLPPPPRTLPASQMEMKEDRQIKELHRVLSEKDQRPNVITLEYFRQFEPLFRKNNTLSENEIGILTDRYTRVIDLYKSTQIIVSASDPRVILTLPPLFTPVRSLSMTKENQVLVARNAAMSTHNVPKYGSDAFNALMHAILAEQSNNAETVQSYRTEYRMLVQQFFSIYHPNSPSPVPVSISEDATVQTVMNDIEWE